MVDQKKKEYVEHALGKVTCPDRNEEVGSHVARIADLCIRLGKRMERIQQIKAQKFEAGAAGHRIIAHANLDEDGEGQCGSSEGDNANEEPGASRECRSELGGLNTHQLVDHIRGNLFQDIIRETRGNEPQSLSDVAKTPLQGESQKTGSSCTQEGTSETLIDAHQGHTTRASNALALAKAPEAHGPTEPQQGNKKPLASAREAHGPHEPQRDRRLSDLTSKFQKVGKKLGKVAVFQQAAGYIDADVAKLVRKEIEEMTKEEHITIAKELLTLYTGMDAEAIYTALKEARAMDFSLRPETCGLVSALEWRRECLSRRPGQEPGAALQKEAWKRGREVAFVTYRAQQRKLERARDNLSKLQSPSGQQKFKTLAGKVKLATKLARCPGKSLAPLDEAEEQTLDQEAEEQTIDQDGESEEQTASVDQNFKAVATKVKAVAGFNHCTEKPASSERAEANTLHPEHRGMLAGVHEELVALESEEDTEIAQAAADMAELRAAQHALELLLGDLREDDIKLQGASELVPTDLLEAVREAIHGRHHCKVNALVNKLQGTLRAHAWTKINRSEEVSETYRRNLVKRKPTKPMKEEADDSHEPALLETDEVEDDDLHGVSLARFQDSIDKFNCQPWELGAVLQKEGCPRKLAQTLQRLALARKRQQEEGRRPPRLHRRLFPGAVTVDGFNPNASLSQPSFASSSFNPNSSTSLSQLRPQTTPSSSVHGSIRMLITSPSSALLTRHPGSPSNLRPSTGSVPIKGMTGWVVSRDDCDSGRCMTAPSGTRIRMVPPMSLLEAPLNPISPRKMEEAILMEMASSAARHIAVSKLPMPKEFEDVLEVHQAASRPFTASSATSSGHSVVAGMNVAMKVFLREQFSSEDSGLSAIDMDAMSAVLGRMGHTSESSSLP